MPLVPPDADYWSPYSGRDAHCGNPLLISLQLLAEDGLLERSELPAVQPVGPASFGTYARVAEPLLERAADRLLAGGTHGVGILQREFRQFRSDAAIASWLEPAALFAAISTSRRAVLRVLLHQAVKLDSLTLAPQRHSTALTWRS